MTLKSIVSVVVSFSAIWLTACGGNSQGQIQYVALGASDVTGVGASPITNGYVYRIEQGIQERTGMNVVLNNFGIPGALIGDIDNVEVKLLKLDNSGLITLSTGGNDVIAGDSVEGFESDLKGLLGKLRSIDPSTVIVMSNLPNITRVPRYAGKNDPNVTTERILGYNAAIARQSAAFNVLLVDLYSIPLDASLVSDVDGFHPNDKGHQVIADAFLRVITPVLTQINKD